MSEVTFYDQNGKAVAYCQDGQHIYLYSGKPVAYFSNDSVYSYSGKHLGRIGNGWIRDNNGKCVYFNYEASGGPIKPIRGIRPIKGIRGIRPIKSVRGIRPIKPITSSSWSYLSSEAFFHQ